MNIGYSCQLLSNDTEQIIIEAVQSKFILELIQEGINQVVLIEIYHIIYNSNFKKIF